MKKLYILFLLVNCILNIYCISENFGQFIKALRIEDTAKAYVHAASLIQNREIFDKDEFGYDPLWHSIANNNIDAASFLLRHGAKISTQDNHGNTLMHLAATSDYSHLTTYLIREGLDVNTPNNAGLTPLHIAAAHNKQAIELILLEYGAHPINLRQKIILLKLKWGC